MHCSMRPWASVEGFLVIGLLAVLEARADRFAQRGLVVFDGEDVVGLVVERVVGQLALGQQGIGGEGLIGEVEGVEKRDGHTDLVGLLDRPAVAYGEGTDLFWV